MRAAEPHLDGDQLLLGRHLLQLGAQQLVELVVALDPGVPEVHRHGVAPELATTDGARGEADLVEVDVDAEHAPRFAVEGDRAGRTAGPRPADRVELADQPP